MIHFGNSASLCKKVSVEYNVCILICMFTSTTTLLLAMCNVSVYMTATKIQNIVAIYMLTNMLNTIKYSYTVSQTKCSIVYPLFINACPICLKVNFLTFKLRVLFILYGSLYFKQGFPGVFLRVHIHSPGHWNCYT